MQHTGGGRVGLRTVCRLSVACAQACVLTSVLVRCGLAQEVAPVELTGLLRAQEQLTTLIQRVEPSVVAIARLSAPSDQPVPVDLDPFAAVIASPDEATFIPGEFGTGVVVASSEDGRSRLVLTNHHVVTSSAGGRDGSRLWIRTSTRHTLPATLHAFDPRSDLAVLLVDLDRERTGLTENALPPISYGDDRIAKGMLVLALGNPLAIARDGSCSASLGIIGNIGRRSMAPPADTGAAEEAQNIHQFGTLLHVDTRLDVGMSGGALVNLEGRLIGLTTSLAALQGHDRGAGFAIPLDATTRRIVDSLIAGLEVEYGFLGITPDDALADDMREARPQVSQGTAARVGRVARQSPAARGGLESGDLVLSVNDRAVYDGNDLIREVGLLGPDATAQLKVFRIRTRSFVDCTVALGKWPVHDDSQIVSSRDRHEPWNGVRVDYSTSRRRYMTSSFLTEYVRAVVITSVDPQSPAAAAGLEPGLFVSAVDEVAVETPTEFYQALGSARDAATLTLTDGRQVRITSANAPANP